MEQSATSLASYHTKKQSVGIVERTLPSILFYYRFLRVVFRSSNLAKHGLYGDEEWGESSFDVMRALESVGISIHIEGLHFIRAHAGPAVFVANHMSTLETIILPGIIQPIKDVTFIVKRGIVEYPVFKHIMLARDPIVLDRVNPREDLSKVLSEGKQILRGGRSIIVFPQTTRTLTFDPSHFNSIGMKLAKRACVPVIPIAVKSDAWGIGRFVKEFGKIDPSKDVHIAFGAPIAVDGRGNQEHSAVIDFIRTQLNSWGAQTV